MGIFTMIWNGIKSLGAMLFPVFDKAWALKSRLRWVLHFVLLFVVLAGLTWLNWITNLSKMLEPPLPYLRYVWLPLLYLLVYLLTYCGSWLWTLMTSEEHVAEFPDLDAAWEEAKSSLTEANIHLNEVPVFLVLGRPQGTETALFAASQLPFKVEHAPRRGDSPLHVYANQDGIYITCSGASVLGRQAEIYAEQRAEAEQQATLGLEETKPPLSAPVGRIDQPEAALSGSVQAITGSVPAVGATAVQEKPEASASPQLPPPEEEVKPKKKAVTASLLKNQTEVDRLTARLRHLCWLIAKDRRPYSPINGMLLLIPFDAVNSESDANQTGLICQKDIHAARDMLQVHCPVFGLVCDAENAPGFREFIERFPKGHRQRRLGQQFPFVTRPEEGEVPRLLESGVNWICLDLFPPLVYRLLRLERSAYENAATILRGNIRLYQLQCLMRDRARRLSRLLAIAMESPANVPLLFGGCYIAGTGKDAVRDQAFVSAVFHRLMENQNFVSWSDEGQREESTYNLWTRVGYVSLGVFVLALVLIGIRSWNR